MKRLIFILTIAACGDNVMVEPTRGDAAREFLISWCDYAERCGYASEYCFAHNYHHMCELEQRCEEPFYPEDSLAQCTEALDAMGPPDLCTGARYGATPPACSDLWDAWNATDA